MSWLLFALTLAVGAILLERSLLHTGRRSLVNRLRSGSSGAGFLQKEFRFLRSMFRVQTSSSKRNLQVLAELPDVLEMLGLALSAGDSLFAALARVIPATKGILAAQLQEVLISLEIGGDLTTELADLARRLPQPHVVEFANKISLAHTRGSPLAEILREQAKSARAELRNQLLKQAGQKETLMLLPLIFLILPVTVMFAVYPSLELLKISYL